MSEKTVSIELTVTEAKEMAKYLTQVTAGKELGVWWLGHAVLEALATTIRDALPVEYAEGTRADVYTDEGQIFYTCKYRDGKWWYSNRPAGFVHPSRISRVEPLFTVEQVPQ